MSSSGYSVISYGGMAGDTVRINAYAEAMRRTITPGCTVLDIGTGTGIMAMMACRLGAGRVYAIEPNDAIYIGRELAAANGFADRIQFFHDISTNVTLPEQVDVMVSDLRGMMPLYGHHLPAIIDARARFLKPGGVQIPLRDVIYVSMIDDAELYKRFTEPWSTVDFDLNMQAARRVSVNSWGRLRPPMEHIALPPQHWLTLDYTRIEQINHANSLRWTAERDATVHGLLVWFEATLLEDRGEPIRYVSSPDQPELAYGTSFFPLADPVSLSAGDEVSVSLRADLVGDDYVWSWNTQVSDPHNASAAKADFRQSTFWSTVIGIENLRKRADGYVPALNADGQIDRQILAAMDGSQSLGEIARSIAEQYPQRFATWQAALDHVANLSVRFSR